jgi:hypothetical protein
MNTNAPKGRPQFTDAQIEGYLRLFAILKRIHIRLLQEGYTMEDGKLYPPDKQAVMIDSTKMGV